MGLLRLYLALCVVVWHGIGMPFQNLLIFDGRQAVQLFYVLSGFYITMVLCDKYDVPGGTRVFYIKRFLRIYPLYLIVLLGILITIGVTGHEVTSNSRLSTAEFLRQGFGGFWSGLLVLVSNIFIVGSDLLWLVQIKEGAVTWAPYLLSENHNGYVFSLNGPAFTLAMELYFYAMAPFIVKRVRRVMVFLALSAAYLLGIRALGMWDLASAYHLFPASCFYFAMGALAFHVMRGNITRRQLQVGGAAYALLCLWCYVPTGDAFADAGTVQMWFLVSLSVLWLPTLFRWSQGRKLDLFLGDMSYVMYVLHYPLYMYGGATVIGPAMSLWFIEISILATVFIERPLERWRRRIGVVRG